VVADVAIGSKVAIVTVCRLVGVGFV